MTAKEFLEQAYHLDQLINSKIEQMTVIKSLATKVTAAQGNRVMQTPVSSPTENAIVRLIDLERELDADIDRFVDLKRQINQAINRLDEPSYRLVLELRYLSYKTWEEIGTILSYTSRNTQYIHRKALAALTDLMQDFALFH